jgi:hypothetical protein
VEPQLFDALSNYSIFPLTHLFTYSPPFEGKS